MTVAYGSPEYYAQQGARNTAAATPLSLVVPRVSTPAPVIPQWNDDAALSSMFSQYLAPPVAPEASAPKVTTITGRLNPYPTGDSGVGAPYMDAWKSNAITNDSIDQAAASAKSVYDKQMKQYGSNLKSILNVTTPAASSGGSSSSNAYYSWAKKFIGRSGYTQGSSSMFPGVGRGDCSAFVNSAVHSITGSYIGGRDSWTGSQMDWFKSRRMWTSGSSLKGAQPGDAIYYKGHVALYIGNGKVVSNGGGPIKVRSAGYRPIIGVGHSSRLSAGDSATSPTAYGAKPGEFRRGSGAHGLQPQMADALAAMFDAMGSSPRIISGYRDKTAQTVLHKLKKSTQPAGSSIHGLGLAVDLSQTPEQGAWMDVHAAEYGIRRRESEANHWEMDPAAWKGAWS